MPEIAFTEIFMIMIIALIVVGPERLPGLARKAGAFLGKMRRFVSSVKEDIDKEIKIDELKKIVEDQDDSTGIHEIIEETRSTFNKAETEYHTEGTSTDEEQVAEQAISATEKITDESSDLETADSKPSQSKSNAESKSSA